MTKNFLTRAQCDTRVLLTKKLTELIRIFVFWNNSFQGINMATRKLETNGFGWNHVFVQYFIEHFKTRWKVARQEFYSIFRFDGASKFSWRPDKLRSIVGVTLSEVGRSEVSE